MRNLSWIGLGVVVLGITGLVFADVFTDLGSAQGDRVVSLVAMTALLLVIGGGLAGRYRGGSGQALKHAAIWLALIAVIALLYTYRGALGFAV